MPKVTHLVEGRAGISFFTERASPGGSPWEVRSTLPRVSGPTDNQKG